MAPLQAGGSDMKWDKEFNVTAWPCMCGRDAALRDDLDILLVWCPSR